MSSINNKFFIFGAGSIAEAAHSFLDPDQKERFTAFVVDDNFLLESDCNNAISFSRLQSIMSYETVDICLAVGYKSIKAKDLLFARFKGLNCRLINIISPHAIISESSILGLNNIIFPGVVIEQNVLIADNNVIWSNVTVCHGAKIGDSNFIAANVTIGGYVSVSSQSFLGFSATICQNVICESNVLLAASSLATSNLMANSRYQGIPAYLYNKIDPHVGICLE